MGKPQDSHADIAAMTFEQAMKELEQIVGQLERGDVELEPSIKLYERGEALRAHCDQLLKRIEAKVEKITLDAQGQPEGSAPLDTN
ncbi:MAG: exodeoxyribonuclease VII small subunit [Alphaproteobacteria bacterium]